jgi:hypothetical protein
MRTALVLAVAGMAMLGAAKAPAPKRLGAKRPFSAIYCVREPHRALRYFLGKEEPDGRLAFSVSHWLPNGALTGAEGMAQREGDHWTFTYPRDPEAHDERYPSCTVRIWVRPDGTPRVEADKVARCPGGYNEELGTLTFPAGARWKSVSHELDYLEGVKDARTVEEQPDICGDI